jgi:hypothetical protein
MYDFKHFRIKLGAAISGDCVPDQYARWCKKQVYENTDIGDNCVWSGRQIAEALKRAMTEKER